MIGQSPVARLHAILTEEQAALLCGDLHGLGLIADRKERALDRVKAARISADDLNALHSLARRNAELLDLVAEAVQSVRALADSRANAPETLAYQADGVRHALHMPKGLLAQKA